MNLRAIIQALMGLLAGGKFSLADILGLIRAIGTLPTWSDRAAVAAWWTGLADPVAGLIAALAGQSTVTGCECDCDHGTCCELIEDEARRAGVSLDAESVGTLAQLLITFGPMILKLLQAWFAKHAPAPTPTPTV